MAAIREMYPADPNRIDLVAIPRKEKGEGLDEANALVLARIVTTGYDWDGEMRFSAFWQAVRGSMESGIKEFDDAEMQEAGVEGAKKWIAATESVWHSDGDKAWQDVKQSKTFVNKNPRKYRVQVKDREGWWKAGARNTPLPMDEGQYALFKEALENQVGNSDLKTDKPGGMLTLKPFAKNVEKLHEFVGKVVRWELRATPVG